MPETVPHSAHTIGALTHVEPQQVVGNPQPLVAVWSHTAGETVVRGLPQHVIALHLGGCTLVEKWRDVGSRGIVRGLAACRSFPRSTSPGGY